LTEQVKLYAKPIGQKCYVIIWMDKTELITIM